MFWSQGELPNKENNNDYSSYIEKGESSLPAIYIQRTDSNAHTGTWDVSKFSYYLYRWYTMSLEELNMLHKMPQHEIASQMKKFTKIWGRQYHAEQNKAQNCSCPTTSFKKRKTR